MITKAKFIAAAAALALPAISFNAAAQAQSNDGYWTSGPAGTIWKSPFGACYRAGYWTPAMANAECDPDLVPKPPAPKPVAAPPPPPPPPPKPAPAPKPAPKPKAAPARAHHSGASGGTAPGPAVRAPSGPGGDAPAVPVPQDRPTPVLPDVTAQDPVVFPEPSGGAPAPARLVAAGDDRPRQGTIPPLLVAIASGLAGAMAAANVSVLRRRVRDSHER